MGAVGGSRKQEGLGGEARRGRPSSLSRSKSRLEASVHFGLPRGTSDEERREKENYGCMKEQWGRQSGKEGESGAERKGCRGEDGHPPSRTRIIKRLEDNIYCDRPFFFPVTSNLLLAPFLELRA